MEESYDEGLANHIGPESCVDNGNIISEVLTGEPPLTPPRQARDLRLALGSYLCQCIIILTGFTCSGLDFGCPRP